MPIRLGRAACQWRGACAAPLACMTQCRSKSSRSVAPDYVGAGSTAAAALYLSSSAMSLDAIDSSQCNRFGFDGFRILIQTAWPPTPSLQPRSNPVRPGSRTPSTVGIVGGRSIGSEQGAKHVEDPAIATLHTRGFQGSHLISRLTERGLHDHKGQMAPSGGCTRNSPLYASSTMRGLPLPGCPASRARAPSTPRHPPPAEVEH
jgi:hypothetical protein